MYCKSVVGIGLTARSLEWYSPESCCGAHNVIISLPEALIVLILSTEREAANQSLCKFTKYIFPHSVHKVQ